MGKKREQGAESLGVGIGRNRAEGWGCAQRMEVEGPRDCPYYPPARRKWEICFQERPTWVAEGTDNSLSMSQSLKRGGSRGGERSIPVT